MHILFVLAMILAYCLIGTLYLCAYVLVYRPEPKDAQLGLTVLFWWAFIIIEVVVGLAFHAGRFGRATAAKLQTNG